MTIHLPYELFTLDNGLRVIVHEDRRAPIACVNVWYHVGSRDEVPGRTGFAHLFEHLMFEGSEHVPAGRFDEMLEEVGAINNGSTSPDRTNYWELLPSHALELGLWLEADRMGGLLHAITSEQLEAQRDVVKNERRQSYENRPYGMASETLLAALFPAGHPYSWPVIGSMADISAATLDDVQSFFRTWYSPGNAVIAVAGDVDTARVHDAVTRYFADIPAGPPVTRSVHAPATLAREQRLVMEDEVSLPRLYMAWHSPAVFAPGDAALDVASSILAHGRASRLYRSLVYDRQVAQSVSAYQSSALLGSTFRISVTARPDVSLGVLEEAVRTELAAMSTGVTAEELERARNGVETAFVDGLQSVGGFGGRADQLNMYYMHTGEPDGCAADLARYESMTTDDVARAVHEHLLGPAVVLSVVPKGRRDLAAGGGA
ncbi:MAG TPA: pitrilysin family protein [Longimicrobiales bacterium]|nr:pitrilysin family protein [Longimicrobiales bacterium]